MQHSIHKRHHSYVFVTLCCARSRQRSQGHPKGATLSHKNIVDNAYFFGLRLKLTPRDIIVCPLPLYHCFGCVLGVLAALAHR